MVFVDVSRAFFDPDGLRTAFVKLLAEDQEEGGRGVLNGFVCMGVGLQRKTKSDRIHSFREM